jgi:hypothetical protein
MIIGVYGFLSNVNRSSGPSSRYVMSVLSALKSNHAASNTVRSI